MEFIIRIGELMDQVKGMEELTRLSQIFFLMVLVMGLLNCFLGYRLLRFWVMLCNRRSGRSHGGSYNESE